MKKIIFFILIMIYFSCISLAQLSIGLEVINKGRIYQCEPILVLYYWENITDEEVMVDNYPGAPLESFSIKYVINSQEVRDPLTPILDGIPKPGLIRYGRILKPHERQYDIIDLSIFIFEEGVYKIKIVADFRKENIGEAKARQIGLNKIYESEMISLEVKRPDGIDLEAWQKARKDLYILKKSSIESWQNEEKRKSPERRRSKELIEKMVICDILRDPDFTLRYFPTSIYATWIYYNNFDDIWFPMEADPIQIEKSVKGAIEIAKRNDYIIDAMPDPANPRADKDGFISFSMGHYEESAAYYKEKAKLILKYHPDFVFADRVRLGLAIAEIALGNEAEGIKQIQDFIQNKQKEAIQQNKEISFEGRWAEEFLKQWVQQKL